MNRRGDKTRRRRASEIAFVYQNSKRNELVTEQIIVIHILKIDGKGYIILENQAFPTLNL